MSERERERASEKERKREREATPALSPLLHIENTTVGVAVTLISPHLLLMLLDGT